MRSFASLRMTLVSQDETKVRVRRAGLVRGGSPGVLLPGARCGHGVDPIRPPGPALSPALLRRRGAQAGRVSALEPARLWRHAVRGQHPGGAVLPPKPGLAVAWRAGPGDDPISPDRDGARPPLRHRRLDCLLAGAGVWTVTAGRGRGRDGLHARAVHGLTGPALWVRARFGLGSARLPGGLAGDRAAGTALADAAWTGPWPAHPGWPCHGDDVARAGPGSPLRAGDPGPAWVDWARPVDRRLDRPTWPVGSRAGRWPGRRPTRPHRRAGACLRRQSARSGHRVTRRSARHAARAELLQHAEPRQLLGRWRLYPRPFLPAPDDPGAGRPGGVGSLPDPGAVATVWVRAGPRLLDRPGPSYSPAPWPGVAPTPPRLLRATHVAIPLRPRDGYAGWLRPGRRLRGPWTRPTPRWVGLLGHLGGRLRSAARPGGRGCPMGYGGRRWRREPPRPGKRSGGAGGRGAGAGVVGLDRWSASGRTVSSRRSRPTQAHRRRSGRPDRRAAVRVRLASAFQHQSGPLRSGPRADLRRRIGRRRVPATAAERVRPVSDRRLRPSDRAALGHRQPALGSGQRQRERSLPSRRHRPVSSRLLEGAGLGTAVPRGGSQLAAAAPPEHPLRHRLGRGRTQGEPQIARPRRAAQRLPAGFRRPLPGLRDRIGPAAGAGRLARGGHARPDGDAAGAWLRGGRPSNGGAARGRAIWPSRPTPRSALVPSPKPGGGGGPLPAAGTQPRADRAARDPRRLPIGPRSVLAGLGGDGGRSGHRDLASRLPISRGHRVAWRSPRHDELRAHLVPCRPGDHAAGAAGGPGGPAGAAAPL